MIWARFLKSESFTMLSTNFCQAVKTFLITTPVLFALKNNLFDNYWLSSHSVLPKMGHYASFQNHCYEFGLQPLRCMLLKKIIEIKLLFFSFNYLIFFCNSSIFLSCSIIYKANSSMFCKSFDCFRK